MNIYLTGASGTGKSTLAQGLSDVLGLQVSPSVARLSPHEMGTAENQAYVGGKVWHQCKNAQDSIVTRTPLDVLAFSSIWGHDTYMDRYRSAEFCSQGNIILFCPLYWQPEDDGFRPTNMAELKRVNHIIREFLESTGAEYYNVLNEPVDYRVQSVIQYLDTVSYKKENNNAIVSIQNGIR